MVKDKKPNMVFLMETELRQNKMEAIQCKLGFACMFVMDCVGKSGSLAILLDDKAGMKTQNYC